MQRFENESYDQERAFYGMKDIQLEQCKFDGEADGESALKECENIEVNHTYFNLRYPFWHVTQGQMNACEMTENCRAAIWYDKHFRISDCVMHGIKAVRECEDVIITNTKIQSQEFGWFCKGIQMHHCELISEYPFMKVKGSTFDFLNMKAKYSFQYTKDLTIINSNLDTKDAFWHSKNVTVKDSVIKGEYLAWYSENLHLVRCTIIGTQPFCYCKNLVLEDCEMIDCDLAFEKSSVHASIKGDILSVKNPTSGEIHAAKIHEIILDDTAKESSCEIIENE